jgi:hypothetical protein
VCSLLFSTYNRLLLFQFDNGDMEEAVIEEGASAPAPPAPTPPPVSTPAPAVASPSKRKYAKHANAQPAQSPDGEDAANTVAASGKVKAEKGEKKRKKLTKKQQQQLLEQQQQPQQQPQQPEDGVVVATSIALGDDLNEVCCVVDALCNTYVACVLLVVLLFLSYNWHCYERFICVVESCS